MILKDNILSDQSRINVKHHGKLEIWHEKKVKQYIYTAGQKRILEIVQKRSNKITNWKNW